MKYLLMMQRLKNIILSNKFLPAVFVFFALQAVFYAWYIGYGIPSDETYHFGAAQYYASQPITTGPFTHNQDPSTIPTIRAIDRDPSYLFHYVLSLPLRLMQAMNLNIHNQVLGLRLINIILAILALYVLKKCLDEISNDRIIKNITLFLLTMTGMTVWLAGSINYDNLANLLFLLFVWISIKIIKKPSANALEKIFALTLAMAVTLTKYTFAPVVCAGLLVTAIILWKVGYRPVIFWNQVKKLFRTRQVLATISVVLLLFFSGLMVERIGINLLRYHALAPKCIKFFTTEQCRTNNVYNRNFRQSRAYTQADKNELINKFDPFGFTGQWLYTMYNTLYFQLGDRRFESTPMTRIFAYLLAISLVASALLSRQRKKIGRSTGFVLFISGFYLAILFLYNMDTYFSFGQQFGFQGRYLLPVLGFVYFFAITMVLNTYRNRKSSGQKAFAVSWLIVLFLFFATHFPPYLLSRGTDPSWRQDFILPKEIVD
jgi:hypothetical protein